MAYQLDRYNNTVLTIVEDGTINSTSSSLKFIGKNYAGYGEIQNENFLYLLENFSGANTPANPLSGQVWFDSGNSKLKFYDGSKWRSTGGSEVGSTEPTGLVEGDFWWDNVNKQLYVYDGSEYILIGPQNAGEGITQMVSLEVLDSVSNTKNIIAGIVNDNVMTVYSSEEFTLNSSQAAEIPTTLLENFDRIRRGVTLAQTKLATNGITTPADTWFWGTASNSSKLGGIDAANYITSINPTFTNVAKFGDVGFTVGDDLDLRVYIESGSEGVIENQTGTSSQIKFKVTNSVGDVTHITTITDTGLIPSADNTYSIGTASLRWANVYGVNFVGEATKATSLRVGSDFRTASVTATNSTVAVRDSSGNLAANLFQGTATSARYADLAEKYTTDQEYPVGTVMAVGGEAETRAAKTSDLAIGVISAQPAYMMNSELEGGQYIGLKGRVPVRVTGPVSKGQAVYAWADGVASTIASNGLVGIALETNNNEGEKLVECVLKV